MKKFRNALFVITILLIASLTFVGCSANTGSENKEITISYGSWADSAASTYLVKNILESELNYNVTLSQLAADQIWQSIANGDADLTVSAWLPKTHTQYFNEFRGEIVNVGPNYVGALMGLAVPSYVDIGNVNQLNENVDKFDGKIFGIEPRSGIMSAANEAIDEYELNYTLIEGDEASLLSELETAINNNEWIVITGWAPHWKFNEFDLKFLVDSKNVFGGTETINTITGKDFADEHPEVRSFLGRFSLNSQQLNELISLMEDYSDKDEAAQKWIDGNKDLVNSWLNK